MERMGRLEELASRYVLGLLDEGEIAELEALLRGEPQARSFFADFCMDEVLLGAVLSGAPEAPGTSALPRRHAPEASRPATLPIPGTRPVPSRQATLARAARAAAALLLTFLGGWSFARIVPPGAGPRTGERSARLTPPNASRPDGAGDRSDDPVPIHYAPSGAAPARLIAHPLDFDESGALSTNPFLEYAPRDVTEL